MPWAALPPIGTRLHGIERHTDCPSSGYAVRHRADGKRAAAWVFPDRADDGRRDHGRARRHRHPDEQQLDPLHQGERRRARPLQRDRGDEDAGRGQVHARASLRRSHRPQLLHPDLYQDCDHGMSDGQRVVHGRRHQFAGLDGVVRLREHTGGSAEHANHDRTGGQLHDDRGDAGRRGQYRVRDLQFPRHSHQRHRQRQPDEQRCDLRDRRHVGLRHHRGRDRVHPDVALQQLRDAAMETAVTRIQAGGEQGTTLLEVLVASALLVTLMAGLMSLAGLAISTTENQGHLAARTTEYAQDKMEQLMALAYTDQVSDTRVFPAATAGGTGLKPGGNSSASSPVDKYVDYLDQSGNLCGSAAASCVAPTGTTPPTGWFYQRVWQVADSTNDGTLPTGLKRITVTATISKGFGGAMKATSTLAVLKTNPF